MGRGPPHPASEAPLTPSMRYLFRSCSAALAAMLLACGTPPPRAGPGSLPARAPVAARAEPSTPPLERGIRHTLRCLLGYWDRDLDGFLLCRRVRHPGHRPGGARYLDPAAAEREKARVFTALNADRDGRLSWAEYAEPRATHRGPGPRPGGGRGEVRRGRRRWQRDPRRAGGRGPPRRAVRGAGRRRRQDRQSGCVSWRTIRARPSYPVTAASGGADPGAPLKAPLCRRWRRTAATPVGLPRGLWCCLGSGRVGCAIQGDCSACLRVFQGPTGAGTRKDGAPHWTPTPAEHWQPTPSVGG